MYKSLLLGGPKDGETIPLKWATSQIVCQVDDDLHLYELLEKVADRALYSYAGVKQKEIEESTEINTP